MDKSDMDKLDIAIVDVLQCDGRASNAKIAREVCVSEGTIRRRLKKLIDEGFIEVRVIVVSRGSGRDFPSIVYITVEPSLIDDVLKRVHDLDEVMFVAITTGVYDIVAFVGVESSEMLNEFLNRLGAIPGVLRTEPNAVLVVGKDTLGLLGQPRAD